MTIAQAISQPIAQAINSPITGGSAAYTTTASDYDGANDYATRGADLTGNADSAKGIISVAFRLDGGDGADQFIQNDAAGIIFIRRQTDNKIRVSCRTGVGTQIDFTTTGTYTAGATWHSFVWAWDISDVVSTNNWAYLYIDDVQVGADNDIITGTVDSTHADHAICALVAGTLKFNGCLSEYFRHHGATVDISVEANRRLFFDAAGKPVNKGADGSTPLGVQPLIYAPDGDPSDNKGSGGNFTITGALTACSSSPTD